MLDQKLIREDPSLIANGLKRRGINIDLLSLQVDSEKLKKLKEEQNKLQAAGNLIGKQVGAKISSGISPKSTEIESLRYQGNEIKKKVSALEEETKILNEQIKSQLLQLPNIPSPNCPDGKNETDNRVIKTWGEPISDKDFKEHGEIASRLGLIDTERSVRISKTRFVTLLKEGARLERALINFMLDMHVRKGYIEVLPPALVNTNSLTASGQLPKFAEETFKCSEDDLWLTPTAEVPITSLHRDEIIPFDKLPLKYVAYSPCFRREAGSYGRDTKGLIRLHQFNKVELYWFTTPQQSEEAHLQITADAEDVLKTLELPYRVVELCTGDLGFSASRTYDLEAWLAGTGKYREISSCSLCGDFQSRRSAIRTKQGNKSNLVHTLNGSGLAIGRTMAAILELGQQKNGNIKIPTALVPYFGHTELIKE